jgi:hypothetical protein
VAGRCRRGGEGCTGGGLGGGGGLSWSSSVRGECCSDALVRWARGGVGGKGCWFGGEAL